MVSFLGGRKTAQEKKTNSWERRLPGTFRTNVPLILPIFSVFSVGGGPKVPRNFVPGNFFFLILGGFSPSDFSQHPPKRKVNSEKLQSPELYMGEAGTIWQFFLVPCFLALGGPYPLTRNYYENNSLRIIFRNF